MKTVKTRREVKSGRALYKLFVPEIKTISDNGQAEYVMSGQAPDRDGDIIHQDGWQLDDFNRHPILLADHNYHDITAQIGEWTDVHTEGKNAKAKLIGTANYYVGEGNEKADWAFNLAKKGRGAVSVGFIPLKYEIIEDEDTDSWWPPIEFFQQSLLECSAVTVPAHQDALQNMVNDKSYDPVLRKIAGEMLDDEDFMKTLRTPRLKSGVRTKCLMEECEEEALSESLLMCAGHTQSLMKSLIAKGGRTLSKANEDRLKSAQNLITEVLDQIKAGDDDEDDKPGAKPSDDDDDADDKSKSQQQRMTHEEKEPKPADDDDDPDDEDDEDDSDDTDDKTSKDDAETCCKCCEQGECKDYPSCSSDQVCCETESEEESEQQESVQEDSVDGGEGGHNDHEAEELTISPELLAGLVRGLVIEPDEGED